LDPNWIFRDKTYENLIIKSDQIIYSNIKSKQIQTNISNIIK